MTKVRTWVGLDVHAAKVVACVVDAESGEMSVHHLRGETTAVVGVLRCAASAGAGCLRGRPDRVLAREGAVRARGAMRRCGAGEDRAARAGSRED